MPVTATISISQIGNGYLVTDAAVGLYGDSEWRTAESLYFPTLDELAADMPRFVKAAVEGAAERARELKEQLAREEAQMAAERSSIADAGRTIQGRVSAQNLAQRHRVM